MKMPILQAHRGVSTECPENTKSAVLAAILQGYGVVELDPSVTADGEIVLLHDRTLNRTCGIEGEAVELSGVSYQEALKYDCGAHFSKKFAGEKIPLLRDILEIARDGHISVKLDNKIQRFSQKTLQKLFEIVCESAADVGFTCDSVDFIPLVNAAVPNAKIHYDGAVDNNILDKLCTLVPKGRLTIWLKSTDASRELCELIKSIAQLGIWAVYSQKEFDEALSFEPDIVETNGNIKPIKNIGVIADMHTHSLHSHDSTCPIEDMAASAESKGVNIFAITDHCDIEFCDSMPIFENTEASVLDAKAHSAQHGGVEILSGIEISEGYWNREVTDKIIADNPCDVIIGSVHSVRFEGYTMPYSQIDFGKMGKDRTARYFDSYFDDVLQLLESEDFDILAHLTCPLRYINGKYGLGLDCGMYKDKILRILQRAIERGIALEVNTSCIGGGYDSLMPEEWILREYASMGGYLITLASDAHIAKNCAHAFDFALCTLKKLGFNDICYFKNRCIVPCRINKAHHRMKLKNSPFDMIKSGKKTFELRLFDEKRAAISIGDVITFTRSMSPEDTLTAEVVALHRFDSFESLYKALPLDKCGYTDEDIAAATAADMNAFYPPEEQALYGVVGIEIKLI